MDKTSREKINKKQSKKMEKISIRQGISVKRA